MIDTNWPQLPLNAREWAPGDWREITQVEDHRLAITLWFDDEPFTRNRWDLVAVRR